MRQVAGQITTTDEHGLTRIPQNETRIPRLGTRFGDEVNCSGEIAQVDLTFGLSVCVHFHPGFDDWEIEEADGFAFGVGAGLVEAEKE